MAVTTAGGKDGREPEGRSVATKLAIVALYTLVFWGLLPTALWAAGARLDAAFGWERDALGWPLALGGPLVLVGASFLVWGISALWTEGGGLPVSALPPPRFARRGPYAWARHPIYLGFQLALTGVAVGIGSPGLVVVSAAFLPIWVAYAGWEERGLVRRFPAAYPRYRSLVGMLPLPDPYRIPQLFQWAFGARCAVSGHEHVPRSGGAILVANHACYIDPAFVGLLTQRPVRYPTTAEAWRKGLMRFLVRRFVAIPVRRYRVDPVACREILRLLTEGELIGMFVERERNPVGRYQGADPSVARMLARLPWPVIPVALVGNYDAGPRWASTIRRRSVTVRAGPPIRFAGDPKRCVDEALEALGNVHDQRVDLEGLDRKRLGLILWRCPRCLTEEGWSPEALACRCGASFRNVDGLFVRDDGMTCSLAALCGPVWDADEALPINADADASVEDRVIGEIGPLRPLGMGTLRITPEELAFGNSVRLPLCEIRTTSTERNDTLQVATSRAMWQFRTASPFRLQRALDRLRSRQNAPALRGSA